jgi:hypothetical protein
MSRKVNCGICGSGFYCEGVSLVSGAGCWCSEIKVSKRKLEEIARRAADCVCPDCLSEEE